MSAALDLALESIGLFTIPEATHPPESTDYKYPVSLKNNPIRSLSIEQISATLGSAIRPIKGLTPLQTKKIMALTGIVLGASLPICTLSMYVHPLPYIALSSTIVGIALIVFSSYKLIQYAFLYDLDNKAVRKGVLNTVRSWNFEKISNTFSFEDFLDYHLLEKQLDGLESKHIIHIYSKIASLYLNKQILDNEHQKLLEVARNVYRVGTSNINYWIDNCRSRSSFINLSSQHSASGHLSHEPLDKSIELLRAGIRARLELKAAELKAPWDIWLHRENAAMDKAYRSAMAEFNRAYFEILNTTAP